MGVLVAPGAGVSVPGAGAEEAGAVVGLDAGDPGVPAGGVGVEEAPSCALAVELLVPATPAGAVVAEDPEAPPSAAGDPGTFPPVIAGVPPAGGSVGAPGPPGVLEADGRPSPVDPSNVLVGLRFTTTRRARPQASEATESGDCPVAAVAPPPTATSSTPAAANR
jgi:hypothetical protein